MRNTFFMTFDDCGSYVQCVPFKTIHWHSLVIIIIPFQFQILKLKKKKLIECYGYCVNVLKINTNFIERNMFHAMKFNKSIHFICTQPVL